MLNVESFYQIMYNNFHIPGVESFEMFVDIWRAKGFHYHELFTEKRIKRELEWVYFRKRVDDDIRRFRWPLLRSSIKVYAKLIKNEKPRITSYGVLFYLSSGYATLSVKTNSHLSSANSLFSKISNRENFNVRPSQKIAILGT